MKNRNNKTQICTIKRRADFVSIAANCIKCPRPTLVLQVAARHAQHNAVSAKDNGTDALLYGITASRKVGCAVERNRAKRRLRALVRKVMIARARRDFAYVLIARAGTVTCAWEKLGSDLEAALKKADAWRDKTST